MTRIAKRALFSTLVSLSLAGCGSAPDHPDAGGEPADGGAQSTPRDAGRDGGEHEADGGTTIAPAECDDGIDNDGDGYVDAALDLGCYAATDPTEAALARDQEDGFTTFDVAADSVVIYVSAEGDDAADGLSPETAVRTLERAASLVRDGENDFLRLRRGDEWRDESLGQFKSGADAEHPIVVTSYGEGPRPRVLLSDHFIDHGGHPRSFFALVGLELASYTMDPHDPGFAPSQTHGLRLVGGGDSILIEDCVVRFGEIIVQSYEDGTYRDFALRRSIIQGNWAVDTSSSNSRRPSGIYASGVDGLLIEDCVFDHNGWNAEVEGAGRNMFNHNMYIQYNNVGNGVVVRNNIVTRGSSHGIHGRPGGLYEGNLFAENAISLQLGYDGHPLPSGTQATARDNVIVHGVRMDADDGSWPRTTAVWGLNLDEPGAGTILVEGNIVAQRDEDGNNVGIRSLEGVTYTDNIQYEWGGGVGDAEDPSWPEPTRDVASYHASIGGEASLEAFLEVVTARARGAWDERYTAGAVNDYIRAGFGR